MAKKSGTTPPPAPPAKPVSEADFTRAGQHTEWLLRLLTIRTQTAIIVCSLLWVFGWVVSTIGHVLTAYFTH